MSPRRSNLMGTARKRGKKWELRWTDASGNRCSEYAELPNRTEALKAAAAKGLEAQRMSEAGETDALVKDLYQAMHDDYEARDLGIYRLEQSWKKLSPVFGHRVARTVLADDVTGYIRARLKEKVSRATVQRELAALRRMFNLGMQRRMVGARPYIPTIETPNPRQGFFELDELAKIRKQIEDPCVLLALTMAEATGWRINSEVMHLTWSRVDLATGAVRLDPGTTKNKDGRLLYLPDYALAELRAWREATTKEERRIGKLIPWVFHHWNGKRRVSIREPFNVAKLAAGLGGKLLHDLRRSSVRTSTRAGIVEKVAMDMHGHKTRAVFDRYNITSEGDLVAAAQKRSRGVATGKRRRA